MGQDRLKQHIFLICGFFNIHILNQILNIILQAIIWTHPFFFLFRKQSSD